MERDFLSQYEANQVAEWRAKYIDYGKFLQAIDDHAQNWSHITQQRFLTLLRDELEKVEDFYMLQYRQYADRFRVLRTRIDQWGEEGERGADPDVEHEQVMPHGSVNSSGRWRRGAQDKPADERPLLARASSLFLIAGDSRDRRKERKTLKKAVLQLYRALIMLRNFAMLNTSAVQYLVRLLDRKSSGPGQYDSMMRIVNRKAFSSPKLVTQMIRDVERIYGSIFKDGKINAAKNELRVRQHDKRDSEMLLLGLLTGMSVPLAILFLLVVAFNYDHVSADDISALLPVFRLAWIPALAIWFWGVDILVWHRARINHVFIFTFDPLSALRYHEAMTAASLLTIVLFACLFPCYLYLLDIAVIPGLNGLLYYPSAMVVVVFLLAVFPFRRFWRSSRINFGLALFQTIIAPFGRIGFHEFFVGDVMTSMVKTMFDLQYTACYFLTGDFLDIRSDRCQGVNTIISPVVSVLPLYWRMMQCSRRYLVTKDRVHIFNTLKYATGLSVVLFSSLMGNFQAYSPDWPWTRIAWLISFVFSTLYTYSWDIFMDWGLGRISSKNFVLRDRLVWKENKWFYYYCMISNFFFRFFWAVTITPVPIDIGMNPEVLNLVAATIEIVRRMTWAILRVENEHLHNCGKFRAIEFIPLPFDKNAIEEKELEESIAPS